MGKTIRKCVHGSFDVFKCILLTGRHTQTSKCIHGRRHGFVNTKPIWLTKGSKSFGGKNSDRVIEASRIDRWIMTPTHVPRLSFLIKKSWSQGPQSPQSKPQPLPTIILFWLAQISLVKCLGWTTILLVFLRSFAVFCPFDWNLPLFAGCSVNLPNPFQCFPSYASVDIFLVWAVHLPTTSEPAWPGLAFLRKAWRFCFVPLLEDGSPGLLKCAHERKEI